ncbi:hypothetical protein LBMAG42_26670 [Deltaproteobacteria bacterium]|nr:hypothetical protein LBMAG42_26670 [Deltaproteobacteria bacterium]
MVRYEASDCEIVLGGVDRYFRAATQVGLADQLTWPVLHPFFEGIRDELGVQCTVASRLVERGEGARLVSAFCFQGPPA